MGCYPHFILPVRSSRGFASTAANSCALFGLAFASAPPETGLTHADDGKSPDHYAKGTPSGVPFLAEGHSPPTACRRVVSGSLSSPCRGSSHRSLALLGSLSVAREYLALRDGPRGFEPGFTCPALLRYRAGGLTSAAYGAVTRCGLPFQAVPLEEALITPPHRREPGPTTPAGRVRPVWAGPRSLAATDGVAFAFSSWGY
jgi:hypothetical protein